LSRLPPRRVVAPVWLPDRSFLLIRETIGRKRHQIRLVGIEGSYDRQFVQFDLSESSDCRSSFCKSLDTGTADECRASAKLMSTYADEAEKTLTVHLSHH
jgi:hypothetical protein